MNLTTGVISVNVTADRMKYDFDSEEDGCVTVRDRDTMEQERIKIEDLSKYFEEKMAF